MRIEGTPASIVVHPLSQANAYLNERRFAEAVATYSAALEAGDLTAKQAADAHLGRARSRQRSGNHAGAIEDYTVALESSRLYQFPAAVARFERALSRQVTGDHVGAIADFIQVTVSGIWYPPMQMQAMTNLGALRHARGEHAGAIDDCQKVLASDVLPAAVAGIAHYFRGTSLEALGRADEAREDLQAAVDLIRWDPETLLKLAERGFMRAPAATLAELVDRIYQDAPRPFTLIDRQAWRAMIEDHVPADGLRVTTTMLERHRFERVNERGGESVVSNDMVSVLDRVREHPKHLKLMAELAQGEQHGCVNQPVATWQQFTAAVQFEQACRGSSSLAEAVEVARQIRGRQAVGAWVREALEIDRREQRS